MNNLRSSQQKKRQFVTQILSWYGTHKASFPWRKTRNPYRILVSEVLLRKTTRKQVRSLYPVFFRRFPTVESLASANRKEVQKIITPLGMERIRSGLLCNIGKKIMELHHGKIPLKKNYLLDLPGVGNYISNAVILFVRNERLPLVDTNSMRVVERVFMGAVENHRVNKTIESFITNLLPKKRYLDFNLALLDFASEVCLPRKPRCNVCPVQSLCSYYKGQKEVIQIFNKSRVKVVSI